MAAAGLLINPLHAQQKGVLVTVPKEGPSKFQWVLIEACAQDEKHEFHLYCRSWIDAREEGRKDKKP